MIVLDPPPDPPPWRRMLDAIGEAVIATDLTGTITFWNAAAEQMYGWRADEVLGRDVVEVTPSDTSRDEAERIMAALARGATWRGRFEVQRRDGTRFPALVTDTPLLARDGRLVGVIGVSVDLTALEAAEQRARRGDRHVAVASLARAALHVTDVGVLVDQAAEVVARECRAVRVELLEHTSPGAIVRGRAGRDAGRTRLAASAPIGGRPGGFGRIDVHVRESHGLDPDETAFVDAVAGVLGGAVARADGEEQLRRVADELRVSDEIRVSFLRATSHELRTPLAAVRGFAETLRDRDAVLDPDRRARYLDVLVANAERLDRLIRDLLDVDRLSSGLARAARKRCRYDEVVVAAVDAVEHPDHRIVFDLAEVTASLDVAKVERVVESLVDNAVRHTPAGGAVTVRLHPTEGGALLAVEDEGAGVEPDDMERIFDPFVQGPEQQLAATPGTGLGLTLVREIATLHGGHVAVSNLPGRGARFEVWVPS